jgi:hypothetical protein
MASSKRDATIDTGIPHNYQDFLLKHLSDWDLESFQKVLGLEVRHLRPISNEGNLLALSQRVFDRAFECPDGSVLDFEFDSTGSEADLIRYVEYAFLLFLNNHRLNARLAPVSVIVIYPAGIPVPPLADIFTGNKLFAIQQKSLDRLINGDELLTELQEMAASGARPFQDKENVVKLPLAVLGQRRENRLSYYREGLKVLKAVYNADPGAERALVLMSLAASQTIGIVELNQILEEFDMDRLTELADAFSRGHYSAQMAEISDLKAKLEKLELERALEKLELEKALEKAERALAKSELEKSELVQAKLIAENDELRAKIAALSAEKRHE